MNPTPLSILIWKAGTNPATETRPARSWISGRLNLAASLAVAPLRSESTHVEDGIFDVVLADGSLPKPGKTGVSCEVLDIYPGQAYNPAKTDAEGNALTREDGTVIREAFLVIRLTLKIAQPATAAAQA
jgi:hypothetical protein